MTTYETKDSGTHLEYASGMRRDSQDGKPRFDLIRTKLQPYEEQMITRYARLLARGAEKYSARNWEDGYDEEELDRAKASLLRHTEQLVAGEEDEDHAAAVWFNAQAIEYFRWRQRVGEVPKTSDEMEDALRLQRLSEINRLALKKAHQIRRRERIRAAAEEFDAELTQDARELAAQEQKSARQAFLDMEAESRPTPKGVVDGLAARLYLSERPENIGLFQFSQGGMPPLKLRPSGVYSQLMAAATAEDFGGQTPPPPLTNFTMKADGEVTDNRTGEVVIPAVSVEEDALHKADREIKESLQLGLDRDQRSH